MDKNNRTTVMSHILDQAVKMVPIAQENRISRKGENGGLKGKRYGAQSKCRPGHRVFQIIQEK